MSQSEKQWLPTRPIVLRDSFESMLKADFALMKKANNNTCSKSVRHIHIRNFHARPWKQLLTLEYFLIASRSYVRGVWTWRVLVVQQNIWSSEPRTVHLELRIVFELIALNYLNFEPWTWAPFSCFSFVFSWLASYQFRFGNLHIFDMEIRENRDLEVVNIWLW